MPKLTKFCNFTITRAENKQIKSELEFKTHMKETEVKLVRNERKQISSNVIITGIKLEEKREESATKKTLGDFIRTSLSLGVKR